MDSLLSGEQMQASAYRLAPLAPEGFGLAIEVVAICLGIIGLIVISLRAYVRLGLSVGLSRSWGLDDILAVIGTVSSPFSPTNVPEQESSSLVSCHKIDHRLSTSLHSRLRSCSQSLPPASDSARGIRTLPLHFINSGLPNTRSTGRFRTLSPPV